MAYSSVVDIGKEQSKHQCQLQFHVYLVDGDEGALLGRFLDLDHAENFAQRLEASLRVKGALTEPGRDD